MMTISNSVQMKYSSYSWAYSCAPTLTRMSRICPLLGVLAIWEENYHWEISVTFVKELILAQVLSIHHGAFINAWMQHKNIICKMLSEIYKSS